MPKVGLHVFPFWTAHFFVRTAHFQLDCTPKLYHDLVSNNHTDLLCYLTVTTGGSNVQLFQLNAMMQQTDRRTDGRSDAPVAANRLYIIAAVVRKTARLIVCSPMVSE